MNVDIRRAVESDAGSVARLYIRARQAGAAAGTIPPSVHDDLDVRHWISHHVIPTLECWVAERAPSTIVGMLVLEDDWVDQLYVEPDLTGAGIGTQLIDLAKSERPDGLKLWTFASNQGAQRFYLRHGFHEVLRTDGQENEERAPDIQFAWLPA